MSILYHRILLWHKLVAQQTGGLALCSAKHKLNRDEARGWADALRAVADDIEEFLEKGTFVLDAKGQRVVKSVGREGTAAKGPGSDGESAKKTDAACSRSPSTQEKPDEVAKPAPPNLMKTVFNGVLDGGASGVKPRGPRVARRK